ncbi:MAG: 23S rRNA pseudouridine(1911/1915/1917) synthase RluD, partial [Salinisphaeraceae bacterium]|nr:23S rRNA pseudouridine(1911/1915/1917) synthase RluD [Salinisphaeraceae bacterium]
LRQGYVRVDGEQRRPRDATSAGEVITVQPQQEVVVDIEAQAMPLNIVFEDEALLVINKPAGLVVHPGAGNRSGTLQNALLHHAPELEQVPRAGIVHRLDKDTTGLMVVARSLKAHTALVTAMQAREIRREYEAIVYGVLTAGGHVQTLMGRHPRDRKRMAVVQGGGREALTHYRVIKRYRAHTHLRLKLETGRTHQIRVHMQHIRHPIVGDSVYGGRLRLPAGASDGLRESLQGFKRQALHARRLGLLHPGHGEAMQWDAPLPDDMQSLLDALQTDAVELNND